MELKRVISSRFKKDFKKIKNNKALIEEFEKVVLILANWQELPEKYLDHQLKWEFKDFRECHIKLDLLLIYKIDKDELILYLLRMWSHSEIF